MIQLIDMAAYKIIKAVRLDGWVLRCKLAETPAAGTVEGLNDRSEAGLGEPIKLPLSSFCFAPWNPSNNCTQGGEMYKNSHLASPH
ncbi:MAG: hypothetical protein ACRDCT_22705 [Shewanella sp.]